MTSLTRNPTRIDLRLYKNKSQAVEDLIAGNVDLLQFHQGETRRRVLLPSYSFQRQRFCQPDAFRLAEPISDPGPGAGWQYLLPDPIGRQDG